MNSGIGSTVLGLPNSGVVGQAPGLRGARSPALRKRDVLRISTSRYLEQRDWLDCPERKGTVLTPRHAECASGSRACPVTGYSNFGNTALARLD